tara:strand:+ start:941 stop:3604 length:2664 start_codon:yes stop_codon:yes gene_type:complete
MVDKIDPTNQTSVEYGQSLLGRKYKQEEKFRKDSKKDARTRYATEFLSGVDNLIKNRAERNMQERATSFAPVIAREKAEILANNKEFKSQEGWRAAEKGMGIESYAQQQADDFLMANKYSDVKDLAYLRDTKEDLYDQFVRDRNLMAKYKIDQYKNNKVSKEINEVEYLANLRKSRDYRPRSGLLKEMGDIFGINKDKAEIAMADLLDPNGEKYSNNLVRDPVAMEKLLSAKDSKGNLIYNSEEQETLRKGLVGKVKDRVKESREEGTISFVTFGEANTVKTTKVTRESQYGKDVVLEIDNSLFNNSTGKILPRKKQSLEELAVSELSKYSAEFTEKEKINQLREDNYDLYSRLVSFQSKLIPTGFKTPTVTDQQRTSAGNFIRSTLIANSEDSAQSKDLLTNFFGVNRQGDATTDQNEDVLLKEFANSVAISTQFYVEQDFRIERAQELAFAEQSRGLKQHTTKGQWVDTNEWLFTRQRPGAGINNVKKIKEFEDLPKTKIENNSTVTSVVNPTIELQRGTQEEREESATKLQANSTFMSEYTRASFSVKNKMLDSYSLTTKNPRVSMEDFVPNGESVRLENNNGYITWNGSQFEQSGVVAAFGALEGTNKELTFASVPEGPMKDLVREKVLDVYTEFVEDYPEAINNPSLLFKRIPPAEAVNNLIDAAGVSFLGATSGDTKIIQKFALDALQDILPKDQIVKTSINVPPKKDNFDEEKNTAVDSKLVTPLAQGNDITEQAINKVSDIFGDGENEKQFMSRLVNYESSNGTAANTFRTTGTDGRGLAQVSSIAFKEIQRRISEGGNLAQYVDVIKKETGIDITTLDYDTDVQKPLHNILMARLYLKINPEEIPSSLEEQGVYYKNNYNSNSKKALGTPEGFVEKNI